MKLLHELTSSIFHITNDAVGSYFPIVQKFLSGEKVEIEKQVLELQVYQANGEAIFIPENTLSAEFLSKNITDNAVAILPITGPLMKSDFCGAMGMQSMANVIRMLADNEKVKSIVLNIDSPGGSVDGTVDVGAAVEYAKNKKNVIAYVDGLCASASYRIAVGANSIIAKQGSIIGSIGTMYQLVDDTEAQQKRGYKLITINADASSEKNLAVDLAKNGDASVLKKELLNPINDLFLADVRKARPQVNESALKGSTYISSKAKSLGLIDEETLLPDIIASELNKIESKKSSMKFFNKLAQFLGLEQMSEQTQLNAEQLEKLEGMQEMHLNAIAEREATIEQQLNTIQSKENEIEDLKQELEALKKAPSVLPTQTTGESTAIKKDFSHVKEPTIKAFFEKTFNNN